MTQTILARTTTLLAAALLLAACSEPPATPETPATPDQLAKIEQVVERFPSVTETYEAAKSDGVLSEQEIIEILQRAHLIKNAQQYPLARQTGRPVRPPTSTTSPKPTAPVPVFASRLAPAFDGAAPFVNARLD